jgi:hypothetical protein
VPVGSDDPRSPYRWCEIRARKRPPRLSSHSTTTSTQARGGSARNTSNFIPF